MLSPDISTHFSWSFKIICYIMVTVLEAWEEILRGDHRLNNCY